MKKLITQALFVFAITTINAQALNEVADQLQHIIIIDQNIKQVKSTSFNISKDDLLKRNELENKFIESIKRIKKGYEKQYEYKDIKFLNYGKDKYEGTRVERAFMTGNPIGTPFAFTVQTIGNNRWRITVIVSAQITQA